MIQESQFANKNVIGTGGAGFIGSHLVDVLASRGAIVTVIDNLQSGKWSNLSHVSGISCITADVTDRDQVDSAGGYCRQGARNDAGGLRARIRAALGGHADHSGKASLGRGSPLMGTTVWGVVEPVAGLKGSAGLDARVSGSACPCVC